ncbi:DUF87 domain-containing protein [Candidatus Parcubacteria bacterium]|nr:MAG: DUF87 domain-containing protein [Candidatus Parcubacteria bacterium]
MNDILAGFSDLILSILLSPPLLVVWAIALLIFLVLLIRMFVRYYLHNSEYFETVIYLVRLPKEKPNEVNQEMTPEKLHEKIALSEMIFAAIGGLRAQRGLRAWWFGRNDHVSFEIVATQKVISFYVATPRHLARYLEQQIQAHFPEAVMEEVGDYNIFTPRGKVRASYLKPTRHFIFPLRTYRKMDADPLNSVLNVMSKLEGNDGMAIQFIVRSAKGSWHHKAVEVVQKAHRTNSMKEALKLVNSNPIFNILSELAKAAHPTKKSDDLHSQQPMRRLSAMEEELLKAIEEKNSKAGLDVNIRIIVNSDDINRIPVYLSNLANAMSQYNYYEYGNSFRNKLKISKSKRLINDFIYRRFDEKISFILNAEELASLYHFPLPNAETPNILWLTAKHAPAPSNIPTEGIVLGVNVYRGISKEIRQKRDDRRRHTYIIGKSGVGKSTLISNMAIQDVLNGEGVCVLDPHGDLVEDILLRIPPERAEDVIIFNPADTERPLALNLIEYDPKYPEQKTFVINEMIKIFDKLYDLRQTGGPIFEQYMRNALLLIMADPESGSTLMEVPKVLADPDFRRMKLERCKDQTVVDFWRKEAEKAGGDAALANIVPYITSKLTAFISNDMMRPIIGQQKSSFNLRQIMDEKKILLISLPKGQVGELNAYLLGMILVGKILMAALSRTDISREQRKDFYLYIDEFQNFTTDSICSILSEARKYNLNLIIAHQYLGQLLGSNNDTTIRDAVFGNVGTWILFKIGSEDAEVMEKEFSPVFNQFDLINIEAHTAYVKLLINNSATRPFSMKTIWPLFGQPNEEVARKIKNLSRLKYGRDRNVIEAEILRRARAIESGNSQNLIG